MSSRTYHPIPAQSKVHGKFILGCFINADSWDHAINRIHRWTAARESRYVCICNVHSLVTARQDKVFHKALINADMATPDGMPIAWMLRQMGFPNQERINGPDLMWNYCQLAERMKEPIFLYGSTPKTLDAIQQKLLDSFPNLLISGTYSPPFRTLTSQEDAEIIDIINNSDARVVFVSLGCPKQELWMAQHRGKINAVMIGVGAAFDYHAGTIKRAPLWMQHHGLEWLHRLYSEPRRLWKRYMVTNSIFIVAAGWQLIAHKLKMSTT
ncbi:WecB/TagA/CpsF family glycosyltransferase [Methylotenera sp.]|uniref:WecB/TagA/CpsF family glycosyltransferase n=1 Tax=Methylotenera sp. TaxID=2051956 RepID=UPI0027332B42|nr:WecB/TagA/CpsF family glycosyltransferase [Methylotenera sp.]MDP3776351.1 WecB/TagA/CpsF family glycosyltransferase [Methylotenera sp.]